MNTPFVSVIVPIFQSEITLRRCLDSILSQTLWNIELILVDDGSTDRSVDICDEYVKSDSRVRLFCKNHSGVSDTRQMGLENAIGEYVIHCDSDDWMEPNMLEHLYQKAKETDVDMVVCDCYKEKFASVTRYKEIHGEICSYKLSERQLLTLSTDLWNKLLRRTMFENYGVKFPAGLVMAEDLYVIMRLLCYPIKISYIPECLYHYDHSFIHNNLTATWNRSSVISNIKAIKLIEPLLNDVLKKKLKNNKVYLIVTSHNNNILSREELKFLFPEVHRSIVITSLYKWSLLPLSLKLIL